MNGLELFDRLKPLRDATADSPFLWLPLYEFPHGLLDGYDAILRECLERPQADVRDWIYDFTAAKLEADGPGVGDYREGYREAMSRVLRFLCSGVRDRDAWFPSKRKGDRHA